MGLAQRVSLILAATMAGFCQQIGPGTPQAGTIRAGETRDYSFEAGAGQFIWLTAVPERGSEVSLSLHGLDGTKLASTTQGEVFAIAPSAGTFRISVRGHGEYALTLQALRTPSADDRRRVTAFVATTEAAELLERRPRIAANTRQAIAKLLEVLPIWRELGASNWEGLAGHDLGNAYLSLQELAKAKTVLLDALPLRRATGDPRRAALTLSTLAAVLNGLGEYRDAVRYGEEALPLRREARDRKGEANTLNNLAFAHNRLNERDRGLELNLQALAIRREIGDREGLVLGLGNLAVAYRFMGLSDRALAFSAEALSVARELGDDGAVADSLSGLGLSHSLLGDFRKAHGYWSEAESLYERIGDSFGLSSAYLGLGTTNAQLRRYPEAIGYYEKSLALRRKSGNLQDQAASLLGHCSVFGKLGDLPKAAAFGEEALGRARRLGIKQTIGRSLRCLGELDRLAGRWEQARARLSEAVEAFRSTAADAVDLSLALSALAAVEMRSGNLQRALDLLKEAQQLVEAERTGLSGELRAALRASRTELYAMEIDALMQLHRIDPSAGFDSRALTASERSRARSLIETIADARLDLRDRMTAEQLRRESELLAKIAEARSKKTASAVDKAERELEIHQIAVRSAAVGAFAKSQYDGALRADQIRLDDGHALVEYALGETRSYVFALTPAGLTTAELPGQAELAKEVTAYRQELARPVTELTAATAAARWAAASRRMYKLLIGPVEKALERSNTLIVAPDGALAFVPFETLTATTPLLEKFTIEYVPSATALAELRNRANRTDKGGTLLALGDPAYARTGDASERGIAWTPLPNTRDEVLGIGGLFAPEKRRIFVGTAASERQLNAQDLNAVRYLHIAAHGYVDEDLPARSGLALSDGVLEVAEILRLRLRAEMVTLSACRSGLGQTLAGEGVMGLSRAFLFAGARSAVVSLWNVSDAATADLMKTFYSNLNRGQPPAHALREAKLRLAKGPRRAWRHPYFWAPFIFIGAPE